MTTFEAFSHDADLQRRSERGEVYPEDLPNITNPNALVDYRHGGVACRVTVLQWACIKGHTILVKHLLVNKRGKFG